MRDFLASTGPGRGIWTSRRGRWGLAILLPSRARPQYSIYGIFSSSDCSREVNSNGHHMGRRSVWGQQEGELPRRASVEGGCLSSPAENGSNLAGIGRSQGATRESPGWRGRSKNSTAVSISARHCALIIVSILLRAPATSRNLRSRLERVPPLSLLPSSLSAFRLSPATGGLQPGGVSTATPY